MSRYSALRYAVRFKVIAKYLSQLYGVLALLLLIPCLLADLSGESAAALTFLIIIVALAIAVLHGRRLPVPQVMQRNEAAGPCSSSALRFCWHFR